VKKRKYTISAFLSFYTIRSWQVYTKVIPSMKAIIIAPKDANPRLLTPAFGLPFCTKAVEAAAADEQLAVPKLMNFRSALLTRVGFGVEIVPYDFTLKRRLAVTRSQDIQSRGREERDLTTLEIARTTVAAQGSIATGPSCSTAAGWRIHGRC
jgi:hypothetical protein